MTGTREVSALSAGRPPVLLGWGTGMLSAFALLGVAVWLNPSAPFTQPVDDWWRRTVGASPDSELYTQPLPMFFQYLGELQGAILLILVVPGVLACLGRWRSAIYALTVNLAATGVSQLAKHLVDRPRPASDPAQGLFGPLFSVDHGSFPSGHAVTVAVVAVGAAALIPAARGRVRALWWVAGGLLMLGIVWQRTLINAHWLSDTLAGLMAGAAVSLLVWWAFRPLLQRDHGRPLPSLNPRRRAASDAA